MLVCQLFVIIARMANSSFTPGSLKNDFLLDPSVTFLNHGSFGATPRPVFEAYQAWQLELERQPVEFIGRKGPVLLRETRAKLAAYLHSGKDDLVFVPNVTHGMNVAARAIPLGPEDEVLATNHEYGAVDKTWKFQSKKSGFRYINHEMNAFCDSTSEWVEQLWAGVTPHTRVIAISHITSPTSLIFPVQEVCRRARQEGILTVIDGAHAPGQIELNLADLGADFYTGNLHKWFCAPKGSAFLYARPEIQNQVEPLVVGWGYESKNPGPSRFIDYLEWTGTRDIAPYLAVSNTIDYLNEHDWANVRAGCHQLAVWALEQFVALSGESPLSTTDWFSQMVTVPLPRQINLEQLGEYFRAQKIEIPVINWQGRGYLRISVQAYTQASDIVRLLEAVRSQIGVTAPIETLA
jgi:isopenicillin-N epimerase